MIEKQRAKYQLVILVSYFHARRVTWSQENVPLIMFTLSPGLVPTPKV